MNHLYWRTLVSQSTVTQHSVRLKHSVTTSEFGFLVHFDKQASADLGGTAKLDMIAEDEGSSVRVELTLNDYIAERVQLVGKTARSIPYGSTEVITWDPQNFGIYRLSVTQSDIRSSDAGWNRYSLAMASK
ncbi:MAG: hypothetical protein ACI96M_001660 [Candidatus Azotimanducaceae bacterium]